MTDPRTEEKTPWGVIGLMLGAAFVVILNETTMAVALPSLMHDLEVSAQTAQWVSTGFMLAMAIVIPTTGFLLNRFTTRQIFLAAMGLFSLGTLMAALAPGFAALLVARLVQGSGTAIMMPLLMTTILQLVPVQRRGQVMGFVSIVMSMAPAMGPTISGLILQFGSWRWIFWVMLPIALIMLVVGAVRMVDVGDRRAQRLDPISVVLSALGFGGLVFALNKVGDPTGVPVLIGALIAGAVGLVLFALRQIALQRTDQPFLDLRTFTHHNFTVGIGLLMIGFLSLMGVALVFPIYLQDVRGLDTMATGLLLLPGGLAMGLLGPVIGRLFDRFGARVLVVPAAAVMTAMIFALTLVTTAHTPIALLVAIHVVLSLALSFMFTPTFTAALNDLDPKLYSHGSALVGTLQQVGGAAGAALLITVMAQRAAGLERAGIDRVNALLEGTHATFTLAGFIALAAVGLGLFLRRSTMPPVALDEEHSTPVH
ncbi:MAG: DHA2 family efflux MFS transporter permease subunit [Propionibacteriaceae bacterium]|nr:DHA2 family efflux MFS transporter permease subunit [Propionibacteriaceae bacterium]